MPSRSGFSIRKLFSPPRRPSHTSDGPSAAAAAAASATALPRLSLDRTEHITIDTINTINTTTITDHSDAHSDDDGLHPDSSITTPQAEHGLIDTVAHELSQDEIDRIKAVVAAAAADAASNLRLRMQAEDAANTADTADDTADTTTATTPIDITALPEPLRKKSRRGRVPQPIVVPPRSLSLASGTRASRANSRCSNCRPAQHHRVNQSDGILAINSSEPEKRKAHLPATPPPSSSSQPLSEKGVAADQRVSGTCSSGSSAVKERQVQAQAQLLLFPATTTAGNSKSDRSSDSSDPNGEVRRQRQQQKKQQGDNNNKGAAAFVDGQPLALPLNRLHPLSAPLMATTSTTASTSTTTPLHPPSTRASLSKPVVLNGISSASTSISKSTSISQLSSSPPHHPAGLIFDPPPTLHPRSSQPATSLTTTTTTTSSSSAAHRRPSLFSSARRRDAPLPATPKSTTKSIPPRSKLRPRPRTNKKPKARPRSLRSGTSSKSGGSSRLGHRKPKTRQAASQSQSQSPLEAEAVDQFDPESLIHPVYRGQYAQPDGKTDSGISLNNKNPLGIIDKETLLRSRSNSHNSQSAASSDFSDAASNACLNLLQALAIQPEEADQLHASELAKAHHAHHAHAANMPSLDSTRSNAHLPDKADVRRLSDPPTTPTFTRPRRAPSPSVSSMMPSSPPLIKSPSLPVTPPYSPPAAAKKKASSFPSPPPLPVEAKKQARFLPALRLTKGSTAAAAAPVAAGHGGGHGGSSSSSSGSSRWGLPGNVSEFINGRLFNRMEVVETLPFEKLKAIRESRALSEQQQKERTVKETLKREAEAEDKKDKKDKQDKQDKQDKVDAERAAQPEITEGKPEIKTGKDKDEDEVEAEVEEYEVSPLESDTPLAHMTQEQIASLGLAVSPTSPDTPPQSPRSSYNGSAHRNGGGPPAQPLPPVPHIASQMVPRPNRLSTVDSLVSGTTQPGDDMSPLEPFHLQDLPSRIDAASLRMSILLPVEEEEAYFASSVAKHKERRRREVEEAKVKAEAEAEAEAPPPPPPSKNPLRFSLPEHQATAMAPVPQLTVTDVDRDGQPSCPVGVVPAPLSPRPPRHPKNHNKKTKKAAAIKDKSARAGHRAVRSTGTIPTSSLATAFQRDEETYVYLPATPYSLVMSTFRHGPVRLLRPEHDSLYFRRGSSGDGISLTSASPISPHRKHMAAVDDTLDWTAFQMAILGGAGDFFQDSVDFGRTSAAEADEAESLHQWCVSMGFDRERLVRSEADEHDSAASQAAKVSVPAPAPSSTSAPTPALTNYQHAHWASFGSASDMGSSGANTRHSGHSGLSGHSGAFYGSTHTYSASTLSVAAAVPGRQEIPASRTPSPSLYSGHAASASASGPVEIFGTEIPGELPCTEIPGELPCTEIPGELPGSLPEPSQQQQQHRKNTASCASFDSYVSMPQSPMADLVMTRGADGKEYVAPMGYNLGHDLGDFLRWETENVCAMDGM